MKAQNAIKLGLKYWQVALHQEATTELQMVSMRMVLGLVALMTGYMHTSKNNCAHLSGS